MPHIKKNALVPYPAESMFRLVNDIEAYPQFLPWCRQATIVEAYDDTVKARLDVAMGPFNRSFTTRNIAHPDRAIELQLVVGPFKHLSGLWQFDPLDDHASKVTLTLEFEFANRLLSASLGPVFHQIGSTMVDAFTRRARTLYG